MRTKCRLLTMKKILLFAEVDLNLIDGSSVWLASLAELLSGSEDVQVHVLLRKKLIRETVVANVISRGNVIIIDPWQIVEGVVPLELLPVNKNGYISPEIAAELIDHLERHEGFDAIIIRSFKVSCILSENSYIHKKLWVYMTDPLRWIKKDNRQELIRLFHNCKYFLFQTEQARSVFMNSLGLYDLDKMKILPPMIPDFPKKERKPMNGNRFKLGYSGKFSPNYKALEMLEAFEIIRQDLPGAEFHIVGDKFHNLPPVENFEERVSNVLKNGQGIVWYGGVTRKETNEILNTVDVATSWRSTFFDDSVEMSTKILEYASIGVPVLMSPSKIHKEVFGDDYPGFVTNQDEFIEKFKMITSSDDLYMKISSRLQEVAAKYTFSHILESIIPMIIDDVDIDFQEDRKTLLIAGHDLKFLDYVIEHYKSSKQYNVIIDKLEGHQISDTAKSKSLLKKADIIFCEWALGNAEWYSNNMTDDQKLVIRLHHQELQLEYLQKINWERVDKIILICQNNMRIFLEKFPLLKDKAILVYNLIDCGALNQPKLPGAEFNLGFIGMSPMRKAPHLALDIFQRLKETDDRYVLFFKGKKPQEYPWLWSRTSERAYYENLFENIENSGYKNAIVFDAHGSDMHDWFRKIGFILSTSDHEGSHQAVAEGMASGAIPIIRNWEGANQIYPKKFVFDEVNTAVRLINELKSENRYWEVKNLVENYANNNFDKSIIIKKYDKILSV